MTQVYVGGSFNLTHDKNADVTNFSIAPEVGYNLNENWAIAAEIGYTHFKSDENKANAFNFAPYARFSFFEKVLSVYSWTVVLVSLPIKRKLR